MTKTGRKRTRNAMAKLRRRALGICMLLTIVLFFTLTTAIYQKAFTPSIDVKLRTASTGNQLQPESDVKMRGVVVGRVEKISPTSAGAELDLALDPDRISAIPANVTANLLPNTLFGERHVALGVPAQPAPNALAAGDVIGQDRSRASIELETVLADTMPVLQAVHPEDLATTLNSLSRALDGRGRTMGETLSQLNTYVADISPALPDLQQNLRGIVGVAETYEHAAPEVLAAMEDLSTTARTLVEQRANLDRMTTQLTSTSTDLTSFLQANGDDLIRLNEAQRPTLDVLAKYAPQYQCLLETIVEFAPRIDEALGVGTDEPGVHITVEIVANRGKYVPNQDEPEFNDKRGPRCYDTGPGLAPQYPPGGGALQDGSESPAPPRSNDDLGLANSPAERDFMSGVLAPSMDEHPQDVPQWSSVLVGPVLRGSEVTFR